MGFDCTGNPSLNEGGEIPNVRVVRDHVSTGYHRAEGNRRVSRNALVSNLPPEIPTVPIRFSIAVYDRPPNVC